MLTAKQHNLLLYIEKTLREYGVTPSYEEMKENLGVRSKSGIHKLIVALEERGFIKRIPNRSRAIDVIKIPDDIKTPEEIIKSRSKMKTKPPEPTAGFLRLNCLPKPNGTPRPDIFVPLALLGGRTGNFVAMIVDGEDFKNSGIYSGDILVIDTQVHGLIPGKIVLSSFNKNSLKLMKIEKNNPVMKLSDSNGNIFSYSECNIMGKVSAVMRSL